MGSGAIGGRHGVGGADPVRIVRRTAGVSGTPRQGRGETGGPGYARRTSDRLIDVDQRELITTLS
jgi:hypothetical protein